MGKTLDKKHPSILTPPIFAKVFKMELIFPSIEWKTRINVDIVEQTNGCVCMNRFWKPPVHKSDWDTV